MQCALKGVGAFLVCALIVALFLPSIRAGGSYQDKLVSVNVCVVDSDEQSPIQGAEVTFFRLRRRDDSVEGPIPQFDDTIDGSISNGVTDDAGHTKVVGTFRASASRGASLFGGHERWYRLGGGWLKVVASGRPVAYVAIDGHQFGGERDYDDERPLQVIVVMNKQPAP